MGLHAKMVMSYSQRQSKNYIAVFKILKTDFFQLWFLYKSDLRISTVGNLIIAITIERF